MENNEQEYRRWLDEGGHSHIVTFPFLTNESIVFEIGVFQGDWIDKVVERYNPFVWGFEPIPTWYDNCCRRFVNNSKINLVNFGLGDRTREEEVKILGDATGIFNQQGPSQKIHIESIVPFLDDKKIARIDLLQSNCEGGEYEIFPALIESGFIKQVQHIIIQFHNLDPDRHPQKREQIERELQKTHNMGLNYDWVFQFWKIK